MIVFITSNKRDYVKRTLTFLWLTINKWGKEHFVSLFLLLLIRPSDLVLTLDPILSVDILPNIANDDEIFPLSSVSSRLSPMLTLTTWAPGTYPS